MMFTYTRNIERVRRNVTLLMELRRRMAASRSATVTMNHQMQQSNMNSDGWPRPGWVRQSQRSRLKDALTKDIVIFKPKHRHRVMMFLKCLYLVWKRTRQRGMIALKSTKAEMTHVYFNTWKYMRKKWFLLAIDIVLYGLSLQVAYA